MEHQENQSTKKIKHGEKNETSWIIGHYIVNEVIILAWRRLWNIKKNQSNEKIKHDGKNETSWIIGHHIVNEATNLALIQIANKGHV